MFKITNAGRGCTVFIIGLWILTVVCFGWNIWKTIQCDWTSQTSWKPEVVHTVGIVVPPASLITVWYGTDDK